MLNDLTSLVEISGFNLAIVVAFSAVSLLVAVLLCSFCNQHRGETDPLIPEPEESTPDRDEETERAFQRIIRTHYKTLGDILDSDSGLLSLLFSKGVINMREKQLIEAQKVDFARNEKLLDQLLKKSELDFSQFIDALKETNQEHIARILTKDGAPLPVHINIQTKLVDVKEIELALVREFNKASALLLHGGSSIDDIEVLMKNLLSDVQQKKARLMKAVPDQSILLYFFCPCPKALANINTEFRSGVLSNRIEQIVIQRVVWTSARVRSHGHGFIHPASINDGQQIEVYRRQAASCPIATVRIRIDDEDYQRCLDNFSRGSSQVLAASITLVIYLQRSFRRWRSFKRQHCVENANSDAT